MGAECICECICGRERVPATSLRSVPDEIGRRQAGIGSESQGLHFDRFSPSDDAAFMQTTSPFAPDALCTDERGVAAALGCSVSLVQKMRQRDDGPPFLKIGHGRGRIRYPVDALRAWIASRAGMHAPERAA